MWDSFGYIPKFIQKDRCRDSSNHLYTYIYKFYSPVTRYHYIIRAECHTGNVFAVKFYCKKDRKSDSKYNRIVNRGDIFNILISCLNIVPVILEECPEASFGFTGAPSIDPVLDRTEPDPENQRFRIYKYLATSKVGRQTFEHFAYVDHSAYLLINRCHLNIAEKEREFINLFVKTYLDFGDAGA